MYCFSGSHQVTVDPKRLRPKAPEDDGVVPTVKASLNGSCIIRYDEICMVLCVLLIVSSYTFIKHFITFCIYNLFHSSNRTIGKTHPNMIKYECSRCCASFVLHLRIHHTTPHRFWPLGLYERGPPKATGRAAEAASITAISITVPWVAALRR